MTDDTAGTPASQERRSPRSKPATIVAAVVIIAIAATAIGVGVSQTRGGTDVRAASGDLFDSPHVIYRSLDDGGDFSRVAYLPANDLDAEPTITEPRCLRVAAAADVAVCLRSGANPAQPYEVDLLDDKLKTTNDEVLNGVPSRARISPDGRYYATTVFVSGHNYISLGFSTETVIYRTDGEQIGNLEDFTFLLNGERDESLDRNVWGVSFAADPNTFYATMATQGRTYLVEGDLEQETLTAIQDNAECPSLSPDGTTLVYKKRVAPGAEQAWRFYAFDLTNGEETALGETRSVDDQVAWLDDENVLYAAPKSGNGGTAADIWKAPLDGGEPIKLIEDADSPTVVGAAS